MTDSRSAPMVRVIASLLLALGALALFLLGRSPAPVEDLMDPVEISGPASSAAIDRGIDSVLATFGIPERDIRKRSTGGEGQEVQRTERRVTIGPEIVPVMVNAAINNMAHRYGARAVASENIRLKTVTIHLELGGTVIHTVILRTEPRAGAGAKIPPQKST